VPLPTVHPVPQANEHWVVTDSPSCSIFLDSDGYNGTLACLQTRFKMSLLPSTHTCGTCGVQGDIYWMMGHTPSCKPISPVLPAGGAGAPMTRSDARKHHAGLVAESAPAGGAGAPAPVYVQDVIARARRMQSSRFCGVTPALLERVLANPEGYHVRAGSFCDLSRCTCPSDIRPVRISPIAGSATNAYLENSYTDAVAVPSVMMGQESVPGPVDSIPAHS
jgi:hypothetical protein